VAPDRLAAAKTVIARIVFFITPSTLASGPPRSLCANNRRKNGTTVPGYRRKSDIFVKDLSGVLS
jgi:hypothetical protein